MRSIFRPIASGLTLAAILFAVNINAQNTLAGMPPPKNWHLMDAQTDGYYGISLTKAYNFLKGKKSKTVVVATLDSGTDTLQADLQGKLWINPKEKPGNDIDDDHNGYIDDIHGWNFLGGPNGKSDLSEPQEEVREYNRLKPQYDSLNNSTKADTAGYHYWLLVQKQYQDLIAKDKEDLKQLSPILNVLIVTDALIRKNLNLAKGQTFSAKELQKVSSTTDTLSNCKIIWQSVFDQLPPSTTDQAILRDYNESVEKINNDLNPDLTARQRIAANNADDNSSPFYGNHLLKNINSSHGTGVAGLIAAKRNNGYGIDGIANDVKIMTVVVSLAGDEFDKDVANGIRYAVDNGARIINMSFGKNLSPHKAWVDAAIKYAAAKNVLLVVAAGNDNQNIDEKPVFPNINFNDGTTVNNFISVGASAAKADENLDATFTNYGPKTVDLFAPGSQVTTLDMDNELVTEDGTSFSAPIVSGVAALVLSYYPNLSASQLKRILLQSAKPLKGLKVLKPGSKDEKVDFTSLSKTGGIVNAYEAVKLAAKIAKSRGKTR